MTVVGGVVCLTGVRGGNVLVMCPTVLLWLVGTTAAAIVTAIIVFVVVRIVVTGGYNCCLTTGAPIVGFGRH